MDSENKIVYKKPKVEIHGNIKTITKKSGRYDDGAKPASH